MISRFRKFTSSSYFLKSFLLLAGSSALAQVVNLIGYPIIARLYNPAEFGVLAAYTSIIGICSSFTTGQYELAIPTVEKKGQAHQLVLLSFVVSALFAILITILIIIGRIANFPAYEDVFNSELIWLIPISIVLINGYTILSTYFIKIRNVKIIFKTKLSQVISKNITQIVGGLLFSSKEIFLILGVILSQSTGLFSLLRNYIRQFPKRIRSHNLDVITRDLHIHAIRYKNYPLYLIPSRLLNKGGLELPVLFFSISYGTSFTGYFSMANQLVLLPFGVVMQSLSKSYINEFADKFNSSPPSALIFYQKFNKKILIYTLLPCVILTAVVEPLILMFLGENWKVASQMAPYLVIFGYFQLVYSTISQTLNVVNRQRLQLKWNFSRVLAVLVLFAFCHYSSVSEFNTFRMYIFTMVAFYIILGRITIFSLRSTTPSHIKS